MATSASTDTADRFLNLLAIVSTNHRDGDTVEHLLRIVRDTAIDLDLGIRGVATHVLRRTSIVACGTAGIPDHELESSRVLPLIAPLPATDCARLGIPVLLADPEQIDGHYPGLLAGGMTSDIRAIASIPIDRDTRTIGVLTIAYDRPTTFTDGHVAALTTLGRICAPMREFDHHETRATAIIERIDESAPTPRPTTDDPTIAALEQRIARLEQLIGFVAGTVAQHLDG
jgi:hypothetical protein